MSQSGPTSGGSLPLDSLTIEADTGSAMPILDTIEIAGSNLVATSAAGSTVTINTPNAFADEGGLQNTALGFDALANNAGGQLNVAIGKNALKANLNGLENTAVGFGALVKNTNGNNNVGIGGIALQDVTTGSDNVSIGVGSLPYIITGARNVAIGRQAGNAYRGSESDNITIGAQVSGTIGESNTLRIGSNINAVHIDGIRGITSGASNALAVQVDSNDKLTQNDSSNALSNLYVDNLSLDGNTLSATDTNGDLNLSADGTGSVVLGQDSSHEVRFDNATATTIGSNGAASALTANPVGYLLININGTDYQIPFYNRA